MYEKTIIYKLHLCCSCNDEFYVALICSKLANTNNSNTID